MAIIKRPEDSAGSDFTGLQSGQGIASAAAIGEQVTRLGEAVSKSGEEFFKAADKSFKDTLYNKALSNATLQYNQEYQARLEKKFDDKGNPTYTTLATDVGKMGTDIMSRQSIGIVDNETKAKFMGNFGQYVNNKQIQALGDARQQHIDYSQAELMKTIKTNIDAGVTDNPANVNYYVSQNDKIIQEARAAGILSSVDAERFADNSRGEIRMGAYRASIEKNPSGLLNQLEKSDPSNLGLHAKEREQLIKEAKAGVRDVEVAAKKQADEEQKIVDKARNLYTKQSELKLARGELGEKQILEDVAQGRLSEEQGIALQIKLVNQQKKDEKEGMSLAAIEEAKKTGAPLVNVKPALLNKSYSQDLQLMASQQDNPTAPISLVDKAVVASNFNTAVPAFVNELEFNLVNEQGTDATGALRAYEHMVNTRDVGVSTMSREAQAVASIALRRSTDTSLSDKQALESARKLVQHKDDVITAQRRRELKDVKAFSLGKIESTIIDKIYDTTDFQSNSVSLQDQAVFSQLMEENYVLTGSEDDAIELTKNQTKAMFGTTVINEGTFRKPLMFFPPEKLYPHIQPEAIKKSWDADKESLASLNNVDSDRVGIIADTAFKQAVTSGRLNEAAYLIVDTKTGQPLFMENGDLARWRPTLGELKANTEQEGPTVEEQITTAKTERAVEKKKQTLLTDMYTGIRNK